MIDDSLPSCRHSIRAPVREHQISSNQSSVFCSINLVDGRSQSRVVSPTPLPLLSPPSRLPALLNTSTSKMAQLSREGLIQVIASRRVEILWDVSFDITSPNIFIQKKVEHNALPGICELALGDADGKAWFTVSVKGLSTALTGETVQVDAELQWIFGSDEGRVWSRDWGSGRFPTVALVDCIEVTYWTQAAASSGGRYDPRQHRRYRFIVNVRRGGLEDDSTDGNEDEDEEKMVGTVSKLELSSMLAQRLSGLLLSSIPSFSRLSFVLRRPRPRSAPSRHSSLLHSCE